MCHEHNINNHKCQLKLNVYAVYVDLMHGKQYFLHKSGLTLLFQTTVYIATGDCKHKDVSPYQK